MVWPKRTLAAGVCAGLSLAFAAQARIFCCEVDGQRTCGNPMPPQCRDKDKKVYEKGVAREVERPPTREELVAREAERQRLAEARKKAEEQARIDRALKESYTSEADIDRARDRAIVELERNAEQARQRLESALQKQAGIAQEKEFYRKKTLPDALQKQIEGNDAEIAAQQQALAKKDADVDAVKARFERDKQRYRQLAGQP